MADLPAAGWYPDPEQPGQQRYWDGQQWTEHRAPLEGGGSPQPQWGGQQQGSVGYAPSYGTAQPVTSQKAVWSMILGILSLVCLGLLAGIPAIILGNSAKREIASSRGAETGSGMAQAGVVMGIISVAFSVLAILFFLLVVGVGAGSGT